MPVESFRYCSCGWEGVERDTCPECGEPTRDGGLAVV